MLAPPKQSARERKSSSSMPRRIGEVTFEREESASSMSDCELNHLFSAEYDDESEGINFSTHLTSYGIHFNSNLKCVDIKLCSLIPELVKRTHLEFDPSIVPQMQKDEKTFLQHAERLNLFFQVRSDIFGNDGSEGC
eukprot:TRINITY_DN6277_c0_g1_i1.p1 TRINITY_DN6277_c0_g1~~TRINITY_DN6277_c0_g1_i1.p1  ORF type:complete len:156 (+),score=26.37 TRINITY_DN6277_c0_g1_i1:59-469(+)